MIKYINMNKFERIFKLVTGMITMVIGGIITMAGTVAPPISLLLMPLGVAIMYPSIKIAQDGLIGNYVKNSCFIIEKNKKVSKNNPERVDRISQDLFAIKQLLSARKDSNKQRVFALEAAKCFEQLKRYYNGETIKYGITSQIYTVMLIKRMQKLGYVNIISNEKSDKKSNLLIERATLGVKKRKRNINLFNVIFTLTDKNFNGDAINEVLESLGIDISNYNRTYTKEGYSDFTISNNLDTSNPVDFTELDIIKDDYNVDYLNLNSDKKYKLHRLLPFLQKKNNNQSKSNKLTELRSLRESIINDKQPPSVEQSVIKNGK